MKFADRRAAGKLLAEKLQTYHSQAVVYALPRGGVETGIEVARALDAPLDLIISRKIGHPVSPEYAICAVTETGPLICNETERVRVGSTWIDQAEANERAEAKRRREKYLAGHQPVSAKGKIAIVVDDGIATGLTMEAAVADLKKMEPQKIIVAVPAAPREAVDALQAVTDEVIVLEDPDSYRGAVGSYYEDFPQLTDQEVIDLLNWPK